MDSESASLRRREAMVQFLRLGGVSAAAAGVGVWLSRRSRLPAEPATSRVRADFQIPSNGSQPQMVVVQGGDPATLVRRAIQELGGIRRFISRGDVVVVKPNAAWDRTAEQAANTNPIVVAEVCRQCLGAGARRVLVADVSVNEPRICFARSGIAAAVLSTGARLVLPEERRFRTVDLGGEVLKAWPVLETFLNADKVINVPIAKHHSLTGASLGIKNWYGILGGPRQQLHQHIHESLADLAGFLRPTLTLMDAWKVLLRNGPCGGNPADTVETRTLIAGTDPAALDAYTAKAYWDLEPQSLRYLTLAGERGLGNSDFASVPTRFVSI